MHNHPIAYSPSHRSRRVPSPAARTLHWPRIESAAIQQWRGMTTSSRHSQVNEQPQIRNQPRSTDSLRSDASLSSSEGSASSNKKSRDVAAHLKYLVRGFLKQTRATHSSEDDGRRELTNTEFFVPSPKVTFLIDNTSNLVCQICQQTPLKLAKTTEDPGSCISIAALLPCGHICCYGCLDIWLGNHASCPFCRTSMLHRGCGHQVQPRLIAQDTIHTLPETLAKGGKIGFNCSKCEERDRREASIQRWTKLAEEYKAARREAEILRTDEAIADMHKAQRAFERIPENDYWVLSSMRHHQW